MPRSSRASVLAGFAAALLLTLLAAAPAFAHVEITPESVPPGTFTTFTFEVPNEQASEDTIALDVSLPQGFLLESAEAVAGWTTKVDTAPDGTPVAIHWAGGHLPPHTFGRFSMTGKVSKRPGALEFPALQRYESSTESWNGTADSEHPVPTVVVSSSAPTLGETDAQGTPQVPRAPQPQPVPPSQTDDLARSRADLALMLAVASLVALLGLGALTLLRRRSEPDR